MRASKSRFFCLAAAGTLAAVLGVLAGGRNVAQGQEDVAHTWTYAWTAPTSGEAVAYYVAEVVVNGADTLRYDRIGETRLIVPVELGKDYMIRVAGIDSRGRRGTWSRWSPMVTFEEDPPTNDPGSKSDG